MIRAIALAVILNLTLLPCALALEAFEAVEDAHDCCPSEINLEAFECCEIDDASLDTRGNALKTDESGDTDIAPGPSFMDLGDPAAAAWLATTGPPDAPPRAVSLHKLNCVYLN